MSNALSVNEREVLLMKHFVADSLPASYHTVAKYIFGLDPSHQGEDFRFNNAILHKLTVFIAILYLLTHYVGISYYIFSVGLQIGSRADIMWIAVILLCFGLDGFVIQIFKLWIRWILLVKYFAAPLLMERINHIRLRAKLILLRSSGVMRNSNGPVQHFNPACRVAMQYFNLGKRIIYVMEADVCCVLFYVSLTSLYSVVVLSFYTV